MTWQSIYSEHSSRQFDAHSDADADMMMVSARRQLLLLRDRMLQRAASISRAPTFADIFAMVASYGRFRLRSEGLPQRADAALQVTPYMLRNTIYFYQEMMPATPLQYA